MKDAYKNQVVLLIDILLEIAKEDNFALHGGTAINLFHLNMPRLSVDIDLTFIPFTDNREKDMNKIRQSLESVKNRLKTTFLHIRFEDEKRAEEELKLLCTKDNATVKVEVNQINRGLIAKPCMKILCSRAEEEFNRFCEIKTVSVGQLWGGKLNAALDRQHPRDLFDVRNLLYETGYTDEIKTGFIFFLLCGNHPFHELLNPKRIDQRIVFNSQFSGMTDRSFSYDEFEVTREQVIYEVNKHLTASDKKFLLDFSRGEPVWNEIDYSMYPAIRWKLLNIQKLKTNNPQKYQEQIELMQSWNI